MTNKPTFICFSCLKQFHQQQQTTRYQKCDYPICNPNSDIITIQKHTLCPICMYSFKSIKMTVKKYKIKGFKHEFKIDEIINLDVFMKLIDINFMNNKSINKNGIYEMQKQQSKQAKQYQQFYNIQTLPHGIYSMILLQTIQQNQYNYLYWLPKHLQYLIYLTNNHNQKIRLQQRKQRIKKITSLISYSYSIQLKQIKYLSIVVHTLLCFMDQNIMVKMLDKVLKIIVRNRLSLTVFFIQDRFSKSSISEENALKQNKNIQYRPQKILQFLLSVIILGDFFKDHKLQKHIKNIVQLSLKQLQQSKNYFIQQQTSINSSQSSIFHNYLTHTLKQSKLSKISRLSQQQWQQLFELKKQQNNYQLILKTIKKQQQQNQQIIKQMQNKYKKQKDEYINKIIKLNNKIEELENQLKQINRKQKNNELKVNQYYEKQQQNKVTPQSCIDFKQFNQDEELTEQEEFSILNKSYNPKFRSQIKQEINKGNDNNIINYNQECIGYLKNILNSTQIMAFNLKYKSSKTDKQKNKLRNNNNNNNNNNNKSISPPTISLITHLPQSIQQLSQLLIKQIKSLKKLTTSIISQNKRLKQQSSRLLNRLKRKDQQWIPLLSQKDSRIAHYQYALLLLEKGVIISEEPMKTRIQIILERLGLHQLVKQKLYSNDDDDISMRDSVLQIDNNNQFNYNQINGKSNTINNTNININSVNNTAKQPAQTPIKQFKQENKQQKKNSLKVSKQSKKSKSDKKADKRTIIQPNITSSSASKKKTKQPSSDCLIY